MGSEAGQAQRAAPADALSSCAFTSARRRRWTQKVHFSITPRARTVTRGFIAIFSVSDLWSV